MVRQITNESDRIAQKDRSPAGEKPAAGAGVERGEKLVFDKDVRIGQPIEQCTFSGVRVADQTDGPSGGSPPDFAFFAVVNFVEFPFESGNPALGDSAVDFKLLFTRSAQSDPAAGLLGYGGWEGDGPDALLRSVVVPPERRGRGDGATLVAALTATAQAHGVGHGALIQPPFNACAQLCRREAIISLKGGGDDA